MKGFRYQSENSLEKRVAEYSKIKAKYPKKIPAIIESDPTIKMERNKYLFPDDLLTNQVIYTIRQSLKATLSSDKAIFAFTEDNEQLPINQTLSELAKRKKNKGDGFLYIYICSESAFG